MIRKAVIILLTTAAMATLALWIATSWHWPMKTACVAHNWLACRNLPGYGLTCAHARLDAAKPRPPSRRICSCERRTCDWRPTEGQLEIEFCAAHRGLWPDYEWGTIVSHVGPLYIRRGDFSHISKGSCSRRGVRVPAHHWMLVPMTQVLFRRWALLLPIPLFLAYPTMAFIRGPVRRWRRRRMGLCLKCGYDLTGNVTGICPECGRQT